MLWFTDKNKRTVIFPSQDFFHSIFVVEIRNAIYSLLLHEHRILTHIFYKNHTDSQQSFWNPCCISTVKASSKRWSFSKTLLNYKTIWTWLHWFWEKFPCFALALSCVTKWMQIILLKVKIHIKYINNHYFFLIELIRLVKDICLNLILSNIF